MPKIYRPEIGLLKARARALASMESPRNEFAGSFPFLRLLQLDKNISTDSLVYGGVELGSREILILPARTFARIDFADGPFYPPQPFLDK